MRAKWITETSRKAKGSSSMEAVSVAGFRRLYIQHTAAPDNYLTHKKANKSRGRKNAAMWPAGSHWNSVCVADNLFYGPEEVRQEQLTAGEETVFCCFFFFVGGEGGGHMGGKQSGFVYHPFSEKGFWFSYLFFLFKIQTFIWEAGCKKTIKKKKHTQNTLKAKLCHSINANCKMFPL